jgi:uncharacterized cupredoxin-like copper-binding protein
MKLDLSLIFRAYQASFRGVLALSLLVLSGCVRDTTASQKANPVGSPTAAETNQVQVDETDFKIDSSITTFTPGTTYHFIVTNHGRIAHEFMILPKPTGSMSGMSMDEMDKMALAKAENIAPNQTVTLEYTFAARAVGSHPEFACYYPGHYEAGMKQDVTVHS